MEYFTYPELPDRLIFQCSRHKAALQVEACKGMWTEANGRTPPDRLALCRNCPLGAQHAGLQSFQVSKLKGTGICSRCHRGGMRLVRQDICVSCWNREREVLVGRNAKGKPPKHHQPVDRRTIRILNGEEIILVERPHSTSTDELIVAALRDSTRQVFFGFQSKRPPAAAQAPIQGSLF